MLVDTSAIDKYALFHQSTSLLQCSFISCLVTSKQGGYRLTVSSLCRMSGITNVGKVARKIVMLVQSIEGKIK